MKCIITIFLFFISFNAFSQAVKEPITLASPELNKYFASAKPPTVSGKIINASPEELVKLSVTYALVTPFKNFQEKGVSPQIKNDGTFTFTLDYPFPYQQIWFNLGDYFYGALYVNRNTHLEFDFAQLKKKDVYFIGEGVKYLGEDGPATDWLNNLFMYRREEVSAIEDSLRKIDAEIADYSVKTDSIYSLLQGIQDEYIKLHPSPYSWIAKNELKSKFYETLLSKGRRSGEEIQNWEDIKQHVPKIISNSGMGFNSMLYSYLNSKVSGNLNSMLYSYRDSKVSGDPSEIRKLVSTPNSDILMLRASIADVKKNEKFQDSLIKVIETPWVRAAMKKKQQLNLQKTQQPNASLKAGLNAGSNSSLGKLIEEHPYGAKLYSADNIAAADFLAKLSSRFKGKAIVLDFWATWCGPCIAAMPSMMSVNKEAVDLPVEFVYLCTSSNSSMDLWKKQVIKMKQQGTHVFLNEKLANELMALFGKGGFPSYVYLDRKGQMSKAISDSEHLSINALKRLVE